MMIAPGHDLVKVVAGGNRAAHHHQQHFAQGIEHPPRLTLILDPGKMLQQQSQTVPWKLFVQHRQRNRGHRRAPIEPQRPANHDPSQFKNRPFVPLT